MSAAGPVRIERLDRGIKVRCDDIYAIASWREIAYLAGPRAACLVFLLVFPALGSVVGRYWQLVYLIALAMALMSMSWDLLASVGLVSLGHSLFFAAGAYVAGYVDLQLGWPLAASIATGTLVGAALSTLLLAPTLRLRGVYFGLLTFAAPLLGMRIIEATKILGGTEGLTGLDPFPNLMVEQYLLLAAVLACVFGFQHLLGSDYGLVLRAIRENDRSVLASGIPIHWFKTQAVFLAALPACLAGSVLAHHYQVVGMSAFSLDYSLLSLTAAMVGGQGSPAGAALGAFLLVPVSELMRAFGTLRVVVYSLVLVLFIVLLPEGIFHYLRRKYQQFERPVPLGEAGRGG